MDADRNVQAQGGRRDGRGGRGGSGGDRGAIQKPRTRNRCHYCGERGHNYRNCPLMAGHMALGRIILGHRGRAAGNRGNRGGPYRGGGHHHLYQNAQPRAQPQPQPEPEPEPEPEPQPEPQPQQEDEEDVLEDDLEMND